MYSQQPNSDGSDGEQIGKQSDDGKNHNQRQLSLSQLLPFTTAADAGRDKRVRVRFDEHIATMLKEHARERALSVSEYPDRDIRNHLLGFAAEVAVATWCSGAVDTRVLDDFSGDNGVDVTAESKWGEGVDRFQVKSTREINNPERAIDRDTLSEVDYAVLCCTDIPERYVEIVGSVHSKTLQLMDDAHGRTGPLLHEEILESLDGRAYQPKDVREVIQIG